MVAMVIGVVECVFFTVVHGGWPSLVYIYQEKGLFSEDCSTNSINFTNSLYDWKEQCDSSGVFYYSLAFGVAIVVQTITFFPVGIFFDKFGILKTRILGTLVMFHTFNIKVIFHTLNINDIARIWVHLWC